MEATVVDTERHLSLYMCPTVHMNIGWCSIRLPHTQTNTVVHVHRHHAICIEYCLKQQRKIWLIMNISDWPPTLTDCLFTFFFIVLSFLKANECKIFDKRNCMYNRMGNRYLSRIWNYCNVSRSLISIYFLLVKVLVAEIGETQNLYIRYEQFVNDVRHDERRKGRNDEK